MSALVAVMVAVYSVGVCCAQSVDTTDALGIVAGAGASLHDAAFGQLPGVPSCCSSYGSQTAISWGISALGTRPIGQLGGLPAAIELRLGFQNLSGRLQRDVFIANVIVGDRVYPGISRFELDATLWAVSVEPLLRIHLPSNSAVGFDVGGRIDWIARASYSQREQLVSPASGAVFETGTTVRNESAGTIPTHTQWGAALQAGISYRLQLDANWTIRPELRAQLALTPVADVSWRVHRILAGVALMRSLAASPAPPPVPMPPAEEPPPPPLVMRVTSRLLGIHRQQNDTALVEIQARRIHHRTMLLPVVFFAANSATLDSTARTHLKRIALVARERNLPLRIAPSIAPGESDSLRRARFDVVRRELQSKGATVAPLPVDAPIPRGALPSALNTELQAAWILAPEPLIEERATTITRAEPSLALLLRAELASSIGEPHIDATVEQDGTEQTLSLRPNTDAHIQLSAARLLHGTSTHYRVGITARDQRQQTAYDHLHGVIAPVFTITDTLVEGNGNGLLMLGRCNFDAARLVDVDSVVIELVRRAISRGDRVTIIGSTDSLGSDAYNRQLARRRIEAALSLLNVPAASVQTQEQIGGAENNGTPYGRIANRGVFVRIEPR
jgi:hypothetical protein